MKMLSAVKGLGILCVASTPFLGRYVMPQSGVMGWPEEQIVFSNKQGPLPLEGTFTAVRGRKVVLAVSGSGYHEPERNNDFIGARVIVEDQLGVEQVVGEVLVLSNFGAAHHVFVPTRVSLDDIGPGVHTVRLEARPGTPTDLVDVFSVSAREER